MTEFQQAIEDYLSSAAHTSGRHVHPRLLKMFELGGIDAVFRRAEGPYLWDDKGNRYLDLLAGGGVFLAGRNHPEIQQRLIDVIQMNLPNLTVVNASALGGQVAQRLLKLAGPQFTKVVFANSGSEATEIALRFARQVTKRRRFLYLEGSFHGRSYGAVSVCGWDSMRENADPCLPVCTPIRFNDLAMLRKELRYDDVAALILEPIQGMTGRTVDPSWLREAENLCNHHGTLLIADEVQTGLGRTGSWFATRGLGVRPHLMTVSKALSGGAIPVGAVLVNEATYEHVYGKFGSGLVYFSTFAENNLAMTSALATLDVLEQLDTPNEAARKGELLREAIEDLAARVDSIDRIEGRGLMQTVYFRTSEVPALAIQQKLLEVPDKGAFAAAVHVDLFRNQSTVVQIPGPGINAIKILPPVVTSDEDLLGFVESLEDTLTRFADARTGPVASLGKGLLQAVSKKAVGLMPGAVSSALGGSAEPVLTVTEKKTSKIERESSDSLTTTDRSARTVTS